MAPLLLCGIARNSLVLLSCTFQLAYSSKVNQLLTYVPRLYLERSRVALRWAKR